MILLYLSDKRLPNNMERIKIFFRLVAYVNFYGDCPLDCIEFNILIMLTF